MMGRSLWVVAVLAVAVATTGIQLDRKPRYVPTMASAVPEPFRAFAQRHIATQALLDKKRELALAEARRLVARRPMPAAHLRLLSIAEFEAGNVEQGGYLIQLAARRGWRDRPAQHSMFQLALAAGDQGEAARRFAALFVRPSEEEAELRALADGLFSEDSEEARAVFAQIVAGAERWQGAYLRKAPVVLPSDALIDVTSRASKAGGVFDCIEGSRSVERLAKREPATAQAFRRALGTC